MLKTIKRWFCRHRFELIGWREASEYGVRYAERLYKCPKCGKEAWIDSRHDNICPEATDILRDYGY